MTDAPGRSGAAQVGGSTAEQGAADPIRVAAYDDGDVREWHGSAALAALDGGLLKSRPLIGRRSGTVWVDLTDPDQELVARVSARLGLHELIAEDIVEGNQRPKIEATDGLVHIVLFALTYDEEIQTHEIDLVLGDGFLVSAHPADWDFRGASHFRAGLGPLMRSGPDHLLWALCDGIVDAYFPFADRVEDEIDAIQDAVIGRADRAVLGRVFTMKRELIVVRRAVSPVREVLNQLTNRELALIDANEIIYFRDIYDHVIRLTDELDTDRELVTATLDVYLSQVNNDLSSIMKRLTAATVVLAGIGAIAGIFGMSEAGSAFAGSEAIGFWIVTGVTVATAVIAALILRRNGWI